MEDWTRPRYIVPYPWLKPFFPIWPPSVFKVDVASDQPLNPFLNGLEVGSFMGAATYIGKLLTEPLYRNTQKETFMVALLRTYRSGYLFRALGAGQALGLGVVAAAYVFRPEEVAAAQAEHQALIAAERSGQIEDLKRAFGPEKLERQSVDNTLYASIGLAAVALWSNAITPGVILHRFVVDFRRGAPLWLFVTSTSCLLGLAFGHLWHIGRTGTIFDRIALDKARNEEWKRSKDEAGSKTYSGGDHLTWIEKYREAKKKNVAGWDGNKQSDGSEEVFWKE